MNRYRAIAEYYDPEHERMEMLAHDVPLFLEQLPKRKRLSILELCSGTGRAAIPIAQAGHRVVGVERDPEMLAIAIRKRDGVGLKERELTLVRGDVLTINLKQKFDRICIFFNTMLAFTTIEQQDQFLVNVKRHLKPRGLFWLDIFHPDHSLLAERESRKMETSSFYVPALDRTVVRHVDVLRDMSRQWMRVTFHYKWFDARGREHRQSAPVEMTAIFPRELQLLLERNGFKIDQLFGNYNGSPLRSESPRMIASCRLG